MRIIKKNSELEQQVSSSMQTSEILMRGKDSSLPIYYTLYPIVFIASSIFRFGYFKYRLVYFYQVGVAV